MKTYSARAKDIQKKWVLVDADGLIVGRAATIIANRLRGKHKAEYTPHVDTGDYIVVVNAAKIRVTGRKAEDKKYYRHTRFPGGLRETNFAKMQARHPGRVLEQAVKGMLPRNSLGRQMLGKLKVVRGTDHPHQAQQPTPLAF